MAKRIPDTEAHRQAAEKITLENELCGDLVDEYVANIPEDQRDQTSAGRRADVRLELEELIRELCNVWARSPQLKDEWKRNRRALVALIRSAIDRWVAGDFVRRVVLHQLATNPKNNPKAITNYLNEKGIGIGKPPQTSSQYEARRAADRQELSRGSRPFRTKTT